MMALATVAPGTVVRRSPEHGKIVLLWISALAAVVLDELEHVFQAHDRHGLDIARLTQAGGQERAGEVLLIGRHLAQRQALALLRDEVPVDALVGIEGEARFAALIGI